jgi:hypothetical protein
MYRRPLWSPHDVEDDGLMRVAAKAPDFEIAVPGVERIAQRRRRLRRSLEAEHALVPSIDGEPVSLLACFLRPLCRRPDGAAVDALSRLGAARENAPCHDGQASRYRLRWMTCRAQRRLETRG